MTNHHSAGLWLCAAAGLLLAAGASCATEPTVLEDTPVLASVRMHPVTGGRGMSLTVELRGTRTDWETTGLTADFGADIDVVDVRVLESGLAEADLLVAPEAALGYRDVVLEMGEETLVLEERSGFLVETGGITIDPERARLGESLMVTITGYNTEFIDGTTFASFGDGVIVNDVEVVHEELALAQVSVDPSASAGAHDVVVYNGPVAVTLPDGFIIDRSAVSVEFEPDLGRQGQTLDFTLFGLNTSFTSGVTEVDLGPDISIDRLDVIDPANAFGSLTISNGALVGLRDVIIATDDEVIVLNDAFEVLEVPPDIRNVQVSAGFSVQRTLDNDTCGAYEEVVNASVVFFEPLDPPCGNPPIMAFPFDINYDFDVQEPADCPSSPTFDAGEYVYFESEANTVRLARQVSSYTGATFYVPEAPLTIEDYVFDTWYDLRADGSEDASQVPAFVVEDVLPTVPADFALTQPALCNNYALTQSDTLYVEWTQAQTFDSSGLSLLFQTTPASGPGRFLLVLPWDDGTWEWGPEDLSRLPEGNGYLALTAGRQGPEFLLPFGSGGPNQFGSSLRWLGNAALRAE